MGGDMKPTEGQMSERMRHALQFLAQEAGPPPSWDRVMTGRRAAPRLPKRVALVGCLVALVGLGAIVVVQRDDPGQRLATSPSTPTGSEMRSLVGTKWWLASAIDAGEPLAVPTTGTPDLGLRFAETVGGLNAVGSDACNGFKRAVTVRADQIEIGDQIGPTTLMACTGGLARLLQTFYRPGEIKYRIDGNHLELVSGDGAAELIYVAIDTPFGPTASPVVDHGISETGAYRLVWDDSGGVEYETTDLDSSPGTTGGAGVGADPGRVNAMLAAFEDRPYLFGILPADTVRVVYEPSGGSPEELTVHDVGDPNFLVIGGFVTAASPSWEVTAYDMAGHEIHRLRWR
jgi:hypothetical protein